jgi:hypothetical protein
MNVKMAVKNIAFVLLYKTRALPDFGVKAATLEVDRWNFVWVVGCRDLSFHNFSQSHQLSARKIC